MRGFIRHMLLVALVFTSVLMLCYETAEAAPVLTTVPIACDEFPSGLRSDGATWTYFSGTTDAVGNPLGGTAIPAGQPYYGLTSRIVNCFRYFLVDIAVGSFGRMHAATVQLVRGALTLYIVFLGIRLTLGNIYNLREQLFVVGFMVAAVQFGVGAGAVQYFSVFFNGQAAMVDMISGGIGDNFECEGAYTARFADDDMATRPPFMYRYQNVWERIDCMIMTILGAHVAWDQYGEGDTAERWANNARDPYQNWDINSLAIGQMLIGLLPTLLGPLILGLGVTMLFLLMAMFIQVIVYYLTSMMLLTILGIFAPLIVPTVLFGPTREIFIKYMRLLFSTMVYPMLLMGALVLTLSIVGFMVMPAGDDGGGLLDHYEYVRQNNEPAAADGSGGWNAQINITDFGAKTEGAGAVDPGKVSTSAGAEQSSVWFPYMNLPDSGQFSPTRYAQNLFALVLMLALMKVFITSLMMSGEQLMGIDVNAGANGVSTGSSGRYSQMNVYRHAHNMLRRL